jgi:hypothetical protein
MLKPSELDKQSPVSLDGWVDIDSERFKEVDDNPSFTKKIIRLGIVNPDSLGRLWGKNKDDVYYPLHLEYGKKKYGIRIAKKAAN